jgi:hypothetical protein
MARHSRILFAPRIAAVNVIILGRGSTALEFLSYCAGCCVVEDEQRLMIRMDEKERSS